MAAANVPGRNELVANCVDDIEIPLSRRHTYPAAKNTELLRNTCGDRRKPLLRDLWTLPLQFGRAFDYTSKHIIMVQAIRPDCKLINLMEGIRRADIFRRELDYDMGLTMTQAPAK
jgi:hypothetical protein